MKTVLSFRRLCRRKHFSSLRYLLMLAVLLCMTVFPVRAQAKASNPLPVTVKSVTSWKEGKYTCTHFTVRLYNAGSRPVTNWSLKLTMNRNVSLRDKWCGKFSVKKKVITITPLSWNKAIPARGTTEIGFIARGSGSISFAQAAITSYVGGKKQTFTQKKGDKVSVPGQSGSSGSSGDSASAGSSGSSASSGSSGTAASGTADAPAKKSGSSKTPLQQHGRLKVKGTSLVDEKGNRVILKGVSTHGINWFPEYVTKNTFKTLRDEWGVQCIRLAMYTQEYNGYCSGGNRQNLKRKIDDGVKAASQLGMYVIIDWHILSDGNPKTHQKEAAAFFKEMSAKYKNYKNVLYEICNEPNGGTSWKTIREYAQTIIKTIRANDKNGIILIGTPTWSQDVDVAAGSPIKGYSNLMYTFHFYAGTHGASYRNKVQTAISKGLPVFVSEFGISQASGSGGVNKAEGNRWISFLKKNGISYVCWNLSNKNESSALLRSSCKKVSGFKNSDLSAQGAWFKGLQ